MTHIKVPKQWLESLLALSRECGKDVDRWYSGTKPLMPASVPKLIGFSSSADSLIEYGDKTE